MSKRKQLNVVEPCCGEYDRTENGRYSNSPDHAIGYRGSDKGRANPEHKQTRKWSEKQAAESGLTDRERL